MLLCKHGLWKAAAIVSHSQGVMQCGCVAFIAAPEVCQLHVPQGLTAGCTRSKLTHLVVGEGAWSVQLIGSTCINGSCSLVNAKQFYGQVIQVAGFYGSASPQKGKTVADVQLCC